MKKLIREYLEQNGMNQNDLCAKLGIAPAQLSSILYGRIKAGPKMIKRISKATGIKAEKLIESAAA